MSEMRNYRYTYIHHGEKRQMKASLAVLVEMGQSNLYWDLDAAEFPCGQDPVADVIAIERKVAILDGLVDLFVRSIEQGKSPSIQLRPDAQELMTGIRMWGWVVKAFGLTGVSYATDAVKVIDRSIDRQAWPSRLIDALEQLVEAGKIADPDEAKEA